ncbi:hypothetical protein F5887DRAFT_1061853 [Amanita rubescens]|nr:hypothetical protein F5887DRAFT_1061853 [Amanita rubescens]
MASQAPGTFLSANPGFSNLAIANADPANWTWDDPERGRWEKGGVVWQRFANKWRNAEGFDRENPSGTMVDGLDLPASQDHSLMIRNCYVEAEKLVWKNAVSLPDTGVIITGQPGIGKTLFIWYLLLRLLRMGQVILLHVADEDVLFYTDGVYCPSQDVKGSHLPSPVAGSLIWSLFDLGPEERVPAFVIHPRCFPVQGPSPNLSLYNWWKQRGPDYTVFPLWTLKELEIVARHSPKFGLFSEQLDNVIQMDNWKDSDFLSTVSNPGLVGFLQEIFPKRGLPKSFEDAFDILLNGLISRFGVIPQQVFRAMFGNFNRVAETHDSALTISFDELQKAADDLSRGDPFADVKGPSYRLISLNNVGSLESKVLQIEFLSPVVSEKFSKRLWDESRVKACSMIKHFLTMPQTRGLAGSMFEPYAHRCIADPDETDGTWALRLMSSGNDPNSFVLNDPESSETVPGFPKTKRQLLSFQLGDLLAFDDKYYIPTIINHPLFDSFAQHLWLLQMTTSSSHKGSPKGYLVAEDIIGQIQRQREPGQPSQAEKPDLKGKGKAVEPLSVEVNYVLVRPAGEKEHKWSLPKGWDQERNVYLLELPLDHDINKVQKADKKKRKRQHPRPDQSGRRGKEGINFCNYQYKAVSEVEE